MKNEQRGRCWMLNLAETPAAWRCPPPSIFKPRTSSVHTRLCSLPPSPPYAYHSPYPHFFFNTRQRWHLTWIVDMSSSSPFSVKSPVMASKPHVPGAPSPAPAGIESMFAQIMETVQKSVGTSSNSFVSSLFVCLRQFHSGV